MSLREKDALVQLRTPPTTTTFEDKLLWLDTVGHPNVYRGEHGWSLSVKMHIRVAGATFEVRSDYNCATPGEAMNQLLERVYVALETRGR